LKVKVTNPNSPYCGQEFEGGCIYYDIHHTGNSPDLFVIKTPDGEKRILSTSIDTEHYWEQRRQEHIKKLGANVGDTVLITRSGGGSFKRGFDISKPHKITGINTSGYVEFDGGEAKTFRPDVTVCECEGVR
jgi:hypothetical protein